MSTRRSHGEFPPENLRQYALLADGERGALCGPHGEIVWMCAPRWHDDAIFSSLIGGSGAYALMPEHRCVWGGYYEPGSLIWRNHWVTADNRIIECRDALAVPAGPRHLVLLRRVEAVDGAARVQVILDARAGFGTNGMRDLHRDPDGTWTGRSGSLYLRWSGAAPARVRDGRLAGTLTIPDGGHHDLVLEIGTHPLAAELPRPRPLWEHTERAWAKQVPAFDASVAPRDTRHAYAIMRGLTGERGGMVAAATMSLPERADNDRNYDYRYVWIRDQCYAGIAVASDGPHSLLHDAVRFVGERLLEDGDQLSPAYRVDGRPVPDQRELALAGYPGGVDVLGNHVNAQFQLDAVGEALLLFAAAARHDALDADGWRAVTLAVRTIDKRWNDADAGVWELDDNWWTHSRLACVAGLKQLAALAPRRDASRYRELAEAILSETARRCVHPDGYWQRGPDDQRVDAALLLPAIRGAVAADDPRTVATLEAVRRQLVEDGYVYRYAVAHRQLGEAEGAFLMCGFLLSLADLQQGNRVEAFRWFERNRAACGPPGLLSEEFDVRQRQLRGNLPQAFVHALLLEASVRLNGPRA